MPSNLGALTVSLGLDAADYTRGLSKAEKEAYEFGEKIGTGIRNAATAAASALAALGVSAGAAVAGFNSLIEGAGKFSDLADKTGASAEALASFQVAASTSGVSIDKVASAANTLTRNLVGVNDESKNAGAALKALGIPLQEFKALKPEDQISKLSSTFATFEDGASKSAVAMALFGKSGADVLPFLKTMEEQGGRNVILTQEMIDQADEYSDRQAKARAELELYAQALAVQAIPAITAFTGALTDTVKELLGVGQGATDLKSNTAVADFAEGAVKALAFVVDAGDGVVRVFQTIGSSIGAAAASAVAAGSGEFARAKTIIQEGIKDVQGILDRELFSKKLTRRLEEGKAALASTKPDEPAKQAPNFTGPTQKSGKGASDDPTKKLLDNQLKEYQRAFKEEEDLLQARNRTLDLFYNDNLVSIEDYYATRLANQEDATAKEVGLIDQQVAALEKYKAAAAKDTDRAAAQGKINALLDEEVKVQRAAGQAALEEGLKKQRAQDAYKDSIDQVRASLLQMQGDSGAAAGIRVEIQNRELLKRAVAENDTAGQTYIRTLQQQTIAQAEFGTQATSASQVLARLSIDEDRIGIARQLGATSELASLQQLGTSRQAAVVQMQAIVAAQEAIAKASGNPALVLQAEEARVALEKLAATADPVAQKFETIFSGSFGDAFADFITGSKTAKQAFESFADSVLKQLARMASEAIAKNIFSGIFGASSGAGGSTGNIFGSLFSSFFGGPKAAGGPVSAGNLYRVNEKGPELLDVNGKQFLMMGKNGGNITPNDQLGGSAGGGQIVNYNFTVGDVATASMVRAAVQNSERRIAGVAQRSKAYGGEFAV